MAKTEVQKLRKKLEKLEARYEAAPALKRKRILKSAVATQAKINRLTGQED